MQIEWKPICSTPSVGRSCKTVKGSNRKKEVRNLTVSDFSVAAGEGFEPSHTESESAVLPLHNPAMFLTNKTYYTRFPAFVNTFFHSFLFFSSFLSPFLQPPRVLLHCTFFLFLPFVLACGRLLCFTYYMLFCFYRTLQTLALVF